MTVADDDGGTDAATFNATSEPIAVDAGADQTTTEGSLFNLTFGFTDAASQTHDAAVLWGDGSPLEPAVVDQEANTASASHTFVQNGIYIISASVSDDVGISGLDTLIVTVLNASPVVDGVEGIVVADGVSFTLALATFTDAGILDTHTATIDWGDGTIEAGAVSQGDGVLSGTHAYATQGDFTVTVTVADDDGGTDAATFNATSEPIAVDAGADQTTTEGSLFDFAFGFMDAASQTHDAAVLWGDGSPLESAVVDQEANTVAANHTFAQNGIYVVSASVSDDVGVSRLDTLIVTVLNATPVVDGVEGIVVADGVPFTLALATFTDAGVLDTHTAAIDWGGGTVATGTVDQGAGTISGGHTFGVLGTHLVTVVVTDSDGAIAETIVAVLVLNPPPVPSATSWGLVLTGVLLAAAFVWARRARRGGVS